MHSGIIREFISILISVFSLKTYIQNLAFLQFLIASSSNKQAQWCTREYFMNSVENNWVKMTECYSEVGFFALNLLLSECFTQLFTYHYPHSKKWANWDKRSQKGNILKHGCLKLWWATTPIFVQEQMQVRGKWVLCDLLLYFFSGKEETSVQ